MSDSSGSLFGIPYNFETPSVGRLLSSYWEPGEGMLVEKPFGVGYSLNLANWRSWVVLGVAGLLLYQERAGESDTDDPTELIVEEE